MFVVSSCIVVWFCDPWRVFVEGVCRWCGGSVSEAGEVLLLSSLLGEDIKSVS